jgi:PD-(D/E)XK endonuclease
VAHRRRLGQGPEGQALTAVVVTPARNNDAMDARSWLGALAEATVVQRLVRDGWHVFTSTTGKAPCDLVAVRGSEIVRVEVKGCSGPNAAGGYVVSLRSVRSNRSGSVVRRLSPDTSDVVAVFLLQAEAVCYFPTAFLAGRNTITLFPGRCSGPTRRTFIDDYVTLPSGAVAEWTKATALKVVDPQGSVGSNPTRSASPPQP